MTDPATTLDEILTLTIKRMLTKPGLTVEQATSDAKTALKALLVEARIDELERFPYERFWSNIKIYKDERLAELQQKKGGV